MLNRRNAASSAITIAIFCVYRLICNNSSNNIGAKRVSRLCLSTFDFEKAIVN